MNRYLPRAIIVLLLLACGAGARPTQTGPSGAPQFVPDPAQKFYLDLDTMNGHISAWSHSNVGSLSGLRATLSVPRIGQDPQLPPAIAICVQDQDVVTDTVGHRICLQLSAAAGKPPLACRVFRLDAGKEQDQVSFQQTVDLNQNVDVAISWATPGTVTIAVGNEIHQYQIPWSVECATVASGTGELKLDPLVFGK